MSFDDIDMKSYAGATIDPAAVDQPGINSYQSEAFSEDFPPLQELLNPEVTIDNSQEVKSEVTAPSKQELNFQALREEVDRLKAERDLEKREHQLQMDLFRANLNRAPQAEIPEKQMFDGKDGDDIPTVNELRREWQAKEATYQERLDELQFAQSHPDYAEVINKFALPLVQQKPHLAQGLNGASNKAMYAYELGKMAQAMQQQVAPAPQVNPNAQRMVENSKKPASLAQAGGQNALSQSDYYATMSDTEFAKFASRNLGQI